MSEILPTLVSWHEPSDIPECDVGDRILVIVNERESAFTPLRPRIIILEARDVGWDSADVAYAGYGFEDGILWAYESACLGFVRSFLESTPTPKAKRR